MNPYFLTMKVQIGDIVEISDYTLIDLTKEMNLYQGDYSMRDET